MSSEISNCDAPMLAITQHLLKPNGSVSGKQVGESLAKNGFDTLESGIPGMDTRPALACIDGRKPITHARIRDFMINEFGSALHKMGFGRGDRIALVLPNGPELGLAIFCTAQWAASVPLSASSTKDELVADLKRSGASLVIGPSNSEVKYSSEESEVDKQYLIPSVGKTDWKAFNHVEGAANCAGVPFVGLVPSDNEAGIFNLVPPNQTGPYNFGAEIEHKSLREKGEADVSPSKPSDDVLILFTSGTTGNKKLVPHQLRDMLIAATVISLSWALTPADINCNLMPLFHVGGIVRQIFSPFVSGSAVICCPRFDPGVFWELLGKKGFTWYYASPTMHQHILETGQQPANEGKDSRSLVEKIQPNLRMIANAAGGLLPSTAEKLRETFKGANILPSYGMTECMPISSPPATYELEKPGTSGVSVGPEMAIMKAGTIEEVPIGEEGRICVRGEPCFRGYGRIANDDSSSQPPETFLPDRWFDTGDLGYVDKDGYLYVTGRSKEVINRGGEIISPMEVEDVVGSHRSVKACAAFSAPHDSLQEVVGIVLVTKDNNGRMNLNELHKHLEGKLETTKWPQCVVYMDDLPKSKTNKLLRVKLGKRFGMDSISERTHASKRHYEAECPAPGTSLDRSIPTKKVSISPKKVEDTLSDELQQGKRDKFITVSDHPDREGSLVCYVCNIDRKDAIKAAKERLHGYEVPTHFVNLSESQARLDKCQFPSPQLEDAVQSILQDTSGSSSNSTDPNLRVIQHLFIKLLDLDFIPAPSDSFFSLGGTSLLASQLAKHIRKSFEVPCSGAQVFDLATPENFLTLVGSKRSETASDSDNTSSGRDVESGIAKDYDGPKLSKHNATFPSNHLSPHLSWSAGLIQALPITIVFPFWQITRYLLFLRCVVWFVSGVPSADDIGAFILAYIFFFFVIWQTLTPLVFVAIKWTVIGRYQPGRYRIYDTYYLRWWFVDICRKLFLRGIWGCNQTMLNLYYRMLGAKIGKNARISPDADIAEYDLVEIGENAAIEYATVRGFGLDNGSMLLGRVRIGSNGSAGIKSIVAPNTEVSDECHLAPGTASYEVDEQALNAKHSRSNRQMLPDPAWYMELFLGGPIMLFVHGMEQLPPLAILLAMLWYKNEEGIPLDNVGDLVAWLSDPDRIPFFIAIRVARSMISPFFYMAPAILIKWLVIGKFQEGPRDDRNQWGLFRHWLSRTLFARSRIQDVTDLVGRHYGVVSALYRALGAKVGKRVFW